MRRGGSDLLNADRAALFHDSYCKQGGASHSIGAARAHMVAFSVCPFPLTAFMPMGVVPATGRWTWGTSSGERLGRSLASLGASFRMLTLPLFHCQQASSFNSHDLESLLMCRYDIFRRSILTLPAPSTASRSGSEQVHLTMHNPASDHTFDAALQWQV